MTTKSKILIEVEGSITRNSISYEYCANVVIRNADLSAEVVRLNIQAYDANGDEIESDEAPIETINASVIAKAMDKLCSDSFDEEE